MRSLSKCQGAGREKKGETGDNRHLFASPLATSQVRTEHRAAQNNQEHSHPSVLMARCVNKGVLFNAADKALHSRGLVKVQSMQLKYWLKLSQGLVYFLRNRAKIVFYAPHWPNTTHW